MVKWSERYNPEKPLASAIATQRLQSGHVNPVWPSTEIDTSIITAPSRRAVIADCSEGSKDAFGGLMQATRVRLSAYYTAKLKNRNRDELLRTP